MTRSLMGIWILSSPNLYHSHSILFVWKKYSKMIYVSALSFFTMTTCIDQQQLLPPPPRLNQHHRTPHPTLLHHCAPSPTHLYIWFNNLSVRGMRDGDKGNMDSWHKRWGLLLILVSRVVMKVKGKGEQGISPYLE